jgi:acylphosphatase
MKSLKLTVKGIVQKVGFRNTVYRAAKKLGIRGYIKNLDDPDESVEAVIQHPDEKVLEEFINKIRINDGFIEVHEILKEEMEEKEYLKFEAIRGSFEEENAERLDVAEMQLKRLTGAVVTGNQQVIEKLGGKLDKVNDNLGEKMDNVGNKLEAFSSATMQRFDTVDKKYGKISEKLDKLDKISDSLERLADVLEAFKPK